MGNEESQPSADGTRTPMSDSGLALGATPREVPRVRRYSSASTQPPSPVDAPDLDMSHLSDAEKSQIEAVISRARELQAEEARRIREIEEEFGPTSASVPVNLSDVGPAARCAECKDVELKGEMKNVCVECERTVCLNCGLYENNPDTKLQQWFCSTCNERRHLMNDVTMWCNGRQEASDFDSFLDIDMTVGRGMKRTTSLTKSLLQAAESGVDVIRDVPETTNDRKVAGPSRGDENGDLPNKRDVKTTGGEARDTTSHNSKPQVKAKPIPPPKPDMSRRGSRESREPSPSQQPGTGRQDNNASRTRGVGQSPDADREASGGHRIRALEVDVTYQSLEEEEAISPGGTRRKQRPQHLTLSRQHSAGSTTSTSSSDSYVAMDRPTGASTDGYSRQGPNNKNNDVKCQPRAGAEGAEGSQSTGSIKKKPSPLDRVGITDTIDPDRNQSPSRRSPKSPPRSPSWMRYRESPPRSPPIYSISPSMSPTERFPSLYVDRTSPSHNREETYGEETTPHSARDHTAFNFDQYEMNSYNQNDSRNHPDRPPPKPARLAGAYQFENELTPHSLDLATYAATVASDTAHLTNMSISPTRNLEIPESGESEYLDVSPEQDSISPPSPNYFDEIEEELDISEPTPKSIDYQNSKRQRVKPPASDWSPVTDLSPILDVSPSIERLEQEKMLEEQARCDADLLFDSPPCTIKRRPKPQALVEPQQSSFPSEKEDKIPSPLKRYQAFDDISKLSSGEKNKNSTMPEEKQFDHTDGYTVDSATPDLIHSVQPIRDIAKINKDYGKDVPQENLKNMEQLRGEPPVRPDLCSGKDGSTKDETAWVRKRIPVRDDSRDNKNNSTTSTADDAHNKSHTKVKVGVNSTRDRTAHGEMERSSSTESTKSKDSASSASKVKPKPLSICSIEIEHDDSLLFSPHYGVLKSPVSPSNKAYRDQELLGERLPGCDEDERQRAYMYPSPVTPPDPAMSPPVPQSPSVFTAELQMCARGHVIQPRVTRATQASFTFESTSSLSSGSTSFESERCRSSPPDTKIQSPGSPGDPKKIRRKLPPVPPEVESPTNSFSRSKSQTPTEAKPDPVAVEKERLRKKLQEKEAEKRRKEKEAPNRPAAESAGTSRSLVDAGSQTKEQEDEMMSKRKVVMTTGTDTAPGSPKLHMNSCNGKLKERPPIGAIKKPPKPPPKPKMEMVNIRGILVPSDIKSLKQRIKEEMQIATAARRLKMEEKEEIRLMERELADREKERRIKAEDDALYEAQLKAVRIRERELEQMKELEKLRKMENEIAANEQKLRAESRRKPTSGSYLAALRMSPQASPRRARHKRQNSDPMIAKFSPIEEVRDIESDLSYKLGLEARRLASNIGRFSPKAVHKMRNLGSVTPPGVSEFGDLPFRQPALTRSSLSRSSEALSKFSLVERDARLATSQSESDLLMSLTNQDALAYFGEEDDWRMKEERKHMLQMEIEKRKRALDENARLQGELRRLSESADISRHELEDAKIRYQQYMRNKERVPTGIIRPIDYDAEPFQDAEDYSQMEYAAYREMLERLQQERFVPPHPSFSSSDYLVHQRDRPSKQGLDALMGLGPTGEYLMADMWPEGRYLPPGEHPARPEMYAYQPVKISGRIHASQMAPQYGGMKDSGTSGSIPVTGPHYSLQSSSDEGIPPPSYSDCTSLGPTDSETSPPNDPTPAMPILDDVTSRSRSLLRDIGSRPLSDDMEKYLQAEDPLNQMYRTESDHSLAESDDVMEGGVTLRRETEKKVQPSSQDSTPTQQRKYDFPTKRILLTRDPKERSVKGNGIGMKIVGGKVLPDHDNQMGAYVSAIYPGGVADQLHGELQEGDQVLEWNGISLTSKTYEEVQRIISMPNGEIELVVKPGANLCTKHSATMSTLRSDSCHSSYDNLEITTSDYEELERYLDSGDGIDPDVLAAQLADIRHDTASPGASPSSSQQEMYHTPSMSTPVSSDPTDPPSPPVEPATHMPLANQIPVSSATDERPPVRKRAPGDKSLGEIQLQLSYDDYDGTLNIHVIQARNLRPKDKNGYSDPFVKVYLLPHRIAENKRRTKYIPRTLDPEWHQTLVFMKISHDDLVTKTLEITVWDYDRFKPNDFLGEVLIDLNNDVFLDNKPHWYKLHEQSESTNAKMAKPPSMSPAPSSSSSTRSAGGRGGGGRGAGTRGGIVGGPGHGIQAQAQGTRGRGDISTNSRGSHNQPAQNHIGPGSRHPREGPGQGTTIGRDHSSEPRDHSDFFQTNQHTASPRSQKPKQTLSSSEQGAAKYSPGLGRKPLTTDGKENQSGGMKGKSSPRPPMLKSKSSDSCQSEKKSDLVSMATLPISLTAVALATTFVTKAETPKSPASTSSSSFSFTEIYTLENSPSSGDTPVRKRAQAAIPSAYPPIVGDEPVLPEIYRTNKKLRSPTEDKEVTAQRQKSLPTSPPLSAPVLPPTTGRPPRPTSERHSSSTPVRRSVSSPPDKRAPRDNRPISYPASSQKRRARPTSKLSSPDTSGCPPRSASVGSKPQSGASRTTSPNGREEGQSPSSASGSPPTPILRAKDPSVGPPGDQPFHFPPEHVIRSALAMRADAPMTSMGEILIGLREDPDYTLLSVAVIHCRDMDQTVAKNGNRDWYVKLYVRPVGGPGQVKKRRTSSQRASTNPSFNEVFHFNADVNTSLLDIALCVQAGRIQKDKQMGKFRIDLRGMKKTTVPKKELFRYYAFGPTKR